MTDGKAFAFAVYWKSDIGGNGPDCTFSFHRIERVDGQPFQVPFVGGPLDGVRPFHQPAHVVGTAFIPLPSERHSGEGRLKVFAQYNSVGDEFHFVQVHRQITKELRIIYDLSGGAFDGRTFDSDAMDSDRDGAFKAQAAYFANRGQVGKCFPLTVPYAWQMIEELGLDAPLRPMHKYTIVKCIEDNYEVLIRAEFVGPYPDAQ